MGEDGLRGGKDGGALAGQAVEGAGGRQALDLSPVEQARVDPLGEIVEGLERPVRLALLHQSRHRLLADAFERAERIPHLAVLDREIGPAGIDVGRQQLDAAAADILGEQGQFVGLRHVEAHRRGEEFGRMMRLQPGGLIGDQGIAGGVALVEAIARELVDQIEQFPGLGRTNIVARAALDEARPLGVHLRLDLLAHGAAEQIGFAQRVAGEHLRRLHHLFLIDEDAVGFLEHVLEHRMRVSERDAGILAVAEQRDVVHRPRPVERHQCNDVAEAGRPHPGQRPPHTFRFQLEHPDRVAALEQFVDRRVVQGQRQEIHLDPALSQQPLAFLQHRQSLQTEEVELHQSGCLDIFHVELGDRHVRARVAVERHQLVKRAVGDDDAGGVGRAVAGQALELHRQVEQALDVLVAAIFGDQLGHAGQRPTVLVAGAAEAALQRPRVGRVVGHQLRQPVDLAIGHLQHPAGILEHRPRLQAPEGDDLGDPVAAVFLLNVGDDLVAVGFAEIDVEVGHRHAFRVEEALEQQIQFDRVEVGDGQRPGDHRPRPRAAPRPYRNVVGLGPLDEVGDDQEVTGEPHADDDVELELQAIRIDLRVFAKPAFKPFLQPRLRVAPQLLILVIAEPWQDRAAAGGGDSAAQGDDGGIGDRLGQVGEQMPHGFAVLEPCLGRGGRPLGGLDIGRIGDAQHGVVRRMELALEILGRIGGDQRQVERISEIDQPLLGGLLDGVAAPAELDIEALREQAGEPLGIGPRLVILAVGEQAGHGALPARGQRDQAVGGAAERREEDVRLFLRRAVEVRLRHQFAEIVVAGFVLGQQHQPVEHPRRADLRRAGDGEQRTDDRLHAFGLGGVGERHGGVEAVAVGQSDGRETEPFGLLGDRLGLNRPFEHAEAGKDSKRDKRRGGHAFDYGIGGPRMEAQPKHLSPANVRPSDPAASRPT